MGPIYGAGSRPLTSVAIAIGRRRDTVGLLTVLGVRDAVVGGVPSASRAAARTARTVSSA